MPKTPRHILQKVEEVKEKRLKGLDLSNDWNTLENQKLDYIPAEIFKLGHLEALDLSWNRISVIPEAIGELENLQVLHLGNNHLTLLPDVVGKLEKLVCLNLSSNRLNMLPAVLAKLRGLISLDLGWNELGKLPDWVGGFERLERLLIHGNKLHMLPESFSGIKNLKHLFLGYNNLEEIPDFLGEFTSLTWLELDSLQLNYVPEWISRLYQLEKLSLHINHICGLPDFIFALRQLSCLDLRGNQIREISPRILVLDKLKDLCLEGNPIKTPPPEVVNKGAGAVMSYFRQLEAEGIDYLHEAKLLIVGEAGAGKTTLSKKIVNPGYQLSSDEKTTEGIDVMRWQFPLSDGRMFRVNLWDFGGQEIYHATHQFFLTRRSFYILVADARREDTDFYYWLNIVQLLSDNCPLVILKNEKQDRHRELNEFQLRGQFENLKEIFPANLATNRGLERLIEAIRQNIIHLPHIGSPLPKTWVKVREALEKDPRNYIPLEEYMSICVRHGFTQLKDKLQLSGYLHDLGVCLHFQDDPLLRKTIILKPKWGTEAVYKILDNRKVIQNHGVFTRADLAEIWQASEYVGMWDELLQLMMNFLLCYRIPGNLDTYIAPQLLSDAEPFRIGEGREPLMMRYSYEFMPKGILTQFIVTMHGFIKNHDHVWKSGVVLEKDETLAEVGENYGKREITIRVTGNHKKDFMTIVVYELDKIHGTYAKLKYQKLIPCNCWKCTRSDAPHFYPFEVLRRFVEDRQEEIQCQLSYTMVNVWGLIDDVVDRSRWSGLGLRGTVVERKVECIEIRSSEKGGKIMTKRTKTEKAGKNAWKNGTFYLFAYIMVLIGFGLLANMFRDNIWVLLLLLIAVLCSVLVIGALQLRQDEQLSEKSFLELIKLVFTQLISMKNWKMKTK